jgi:hypothetical protein
MFVKQIFEDLEKTPPSEIELAKKRRADWIRRYGTKDDTE